MNAGPRTTHASAPGRAGLLGGLRRLAKYDARLARALRAIGWPLFDLLTRWSLAQSFVVSGLLKLADWDTARYLAAHEYPVSWLPPTEAAVIGVTIECLGGVMFAAGLGARYAALSLLLLTVVAQTSYVALDLNLAWIALFAWYVVHGAGSLSLDAMLRHGIADSALPVLPHVVRAGAALRRIGAAPALAVVRGWLGAASLAASLGADASNLLPVATLAILPAPLSGLLGVLLLAGAATRWCAVGLALALSSSMLMLAMNPAALGLSAVCMLLVMRGGGSFSVDSLCARVIGAGEPASTPGCGPDGAPLPRVVIVGGGFAGVSCAQRLRDAPVAVTLVDRANHHLFQPLLYQVATAAVSPGDIATPLRSLFKEARNTRVLLGNVVGVDTAARRVMLDDSSLPFDYLVLATGATHGYFGREDWQAFAPGLKRIEDATEIRRRLLTAFERAEAATDANERAALLTFLVVGGGPTGVELAGAIAELAHHGMEKEFRSFDPAQARVLLVQSGPRVLPAFEPRLSEIARRSLERLGVEVLLGGRVEEIDDQGVLVSGKRIAARTVLWAAGVRASPAARWLQVPADNAGRACVDAHLRVPGDGTIFVVGDTAASMAWRGQPVPGLAPAAKQAGAHAARVIDALVEGRELPPPFRYQHLGSLATIGRQAAVADFGRVRLWGAPAWWLWGLVHVGFLVGLRNRIATMVNWFWLYLTYGSGIRLITGGREPAG